MGAKQNRGDAREGLAEAGAGLEILTDIRSGQDVGRPHRTVPHREQLLGFPGQLEDTNRTVDRARFSFSLLMPALL